jgi:subtilisin family serine protease
MSIDSRARWGMGQRIDPHLDAHVGRISARAPTVEDPTQPVSGHIELEGDRPWMVLQALLAVLYGESPAAGLVAGASLLDRVRVGLGTPEIRQAWTHVREIRYLTTDPACGVALPMYAYMPSGKEQASPDERRAALQRAVDALDAASGQRLRQARRISLMVTFDLSRTARELDRVINGGLREVSRATAEEEVRQVMFGVPRPPAGLQDLAGRLVGAPSLLSQKLGLSGSCRPQLAQAMRLLHTPPLPAAGPLDYGFPETGRNTIVGIVDFGCDFAHPSFRTGPQLLQSRILALWDQNPAAAAPPALVVNGQALQFGFGRLFTRTDIEAALATWQATAPNDPDAPYRLLQYDPHQNHYTSQSVGSQNGPAGAHGTFVMEAAAGSCRSVGVAAGAPAPSGVASSADIVFVQVRQRTAPDGRRVLDLNDVIEAVGFVFHVAEQNQRPCVVNLSLNTMSGPHDGDGFFERALSSLLRSGSAGPEGRGRAAVIAAGNLPDSASQAVRWQHLTDEVVAGTGFTFHWRMPPLDPTPNSVEIWYDAIGGQLQVTLTSPAGETLGPVGPGEAVDLTEAGMWAGSIVGSRLDGTANHPERHVILLQLAGGAPQAAHWQVLLEVVPTAAAAARIPFDAWLERDDEGPSGLSRQDPPPLAVDPRDFRCTIGTLSCAEDAIVVAGYSTYYSVPAPWGLSGHGPSRRDTIRKPDLAAPGHFVSLVCSRRAAGPSSLYRVTGTSVAAPFVTGTIACVYERAPRASLAEVRDALVQSALPLPGMAGGWSSDQGHGCLHPAGVLGRF